MADQRFSTFNPMDLTGKRILITGASSGIGRACAVMASQLGASCVLVARNEAGLSETLALMNTEVSLRHSFALCDLTDLDSIISVFDNSIQNGKFAGLVHAAGICNAVPIAFQSAKEMQMAMALNYYAFLEMMKIISKRKYFEKGSVVGVSSISASVGWKGGVAYSGTKGALSASIRSLALEFAEKGIRVNGVQPSNIQTPMFDALAAEMNSEEGMNELLKKQPLGLGRPEDVAAAICFLLSDAANFITGTNLVVDGGYLAQ
jgi:NAD(P)-dependent dehydrogenase (short-subunit alcohol dehydrogenase family)